MGPLKGCQPNPQKTPQNAIAPVPEILGQKNVILTWQHDKSILMSSQKMLSLFVHSKVFFSPSVLYIVKETITAGQYSTIYVYI